MAKSKAGRILVKLKNKESNFTYHTHKNKKNTKERISMNKYAPDLRKRVLFTED